MTYLTKPFRVLWTEWDLEKKRSHSFVYYKKFVTIEEAEAQMHKMSESSTWRECELAVIQETGKTAEGRDIR